MTLYVGTSFLRVIYSILNASVILKRNENILARNETHLAGNENCLARNETRLARNETRGGNLHLSATVVMSGHDIKVTCHERAMTEFMSNVNIKSVSATPAFFSDHTAVNALINGF